jgi:hypothetical protein
MDGQEVFESLSKMTEEERKLCALDWLVDGARVRDLLEYVVDDMFWKSDDPDKHKEELLAKLSNDRLALIVSAAFYSMDETVVSNYSDEFYDNLRAHIREILEEEA